MECDLVYALEALFEMLLDALRLLRVAQNLNQVVIREEEEPREVVSLGFEILIEVLLNVFQIHVALFENRVQVLYLVEV